MSGPTMAQWRWAAGSDTGCSSAAIWTRMTGESAGRFGSWPDHYPMDAWDLGRCIRLLDLFPEWRPRLDEMREVHAGWCPIVDAWDSLVAIYREKGEESPRLQAAYELQMAGRCLCGRRVLGDGGWPANEHHSRNQCRSSTESTSALRARRGSAGEGA